MNAQEKFLKFKQSWIDAKGNEPLRTEIEKQMADFVNSLDEAQRAEFANAAQADLHSEIKQTQELSHIVDIRKQMKEVLPIVSVSHIAKTYFNRSASWFYQRLNGNLVHGKPATFTPEEIDTLNHAFEDIGKKIGTFRVSC